MPQLQKIFIKIFSKKNQTGGKRLRSAYPASVIVIIPHGELIKVDFNKISLFNSFCENRVKFVMRQFITLNRELGISLGACIREFQTTFRISEEAWSFESIKKDFTRHPVGTSLKNTIEGMRFNVNNTLMFNLNEAGMISAKFYNQLLSIRIQNYETSKNNLPSSQMVAVEEIAGN